MDVAIVICVVAKAVAMVIGSCLALEVIFRCRYCNWEVIELYIKPNLLKILNFSKEKHYDVKIMLINV